MFGWKNKIKAEISNIYGLLAKNEAILQAMTTNMASLRGLINRKLGGKSAPNDEEPQDSREQILKDLEEVRRQFGGDLPIELREKYNNYANLKE